MNKEKTTSTLYFGNITLRALVYIATKNRKRFAFPLLCYFQPELSWSINWVAWVTVWYTFKFYFIFFHHSFNSTLLSFSEQISNCIWPWSVAGAENSCRLVVPLSPCLRTQLIISLCRSWLQSQMMKSTRKKQTAYWESWKLDTLETCSSQECSTVYIFTKTLNQPTIFIAILGDDKYLDELPQEKVQDFRDPRSIQDHDGWIE